jgi:hypothetical protein
MKMVFGSNLRQRIFIGTSNGGVARLSAWLMDHRTL